MLYKAELDKLQGPNSHLNQSYDFVGRRQAAVLTDPGSHKNNLPPTSLYLDENMNRHNEKIYNHNQVVNTRMKNFHQYLEQTGPKDHLAARKDQYHNLNDNIYLPQRQKNQEARVFNDMQQREASRRTQRTGLERQV